MNQVLIDSLKVTLRHVREREEKCRDAVLAIQRLLESEGALYPEAAVAETQPKAPTPGEEITASAGAAFRRIKAAKASRQTDAAARTKTCPHCGDQYLARRKDQTNCLAPACRRAAAKAYGKSHDLEKALRAAHKAPVAPKAAPVAAPAPVSRVDLIKAAVARLDGIPDGVRAAAAEQRESEAM